MKIYDYEVEKIDNTSIKLEEYKDKVLLIVNTASKCGFTPQFEGLELLYEKYKNQGFEILGFPCNQFANQDPLSDEEIHSFCSLNYGVSFPMFKKIEVNGENSHPLYKYLKEAKKGTFGSNIKWNFTKFLFDREGNLVKRFEPTFALNKLEDNIVKLL